MKPGFIPFGFTLVEILVAMVVLALGLLGMAAMTVLVVRGNRSANNLTTATNLCQLKMEELKDIDWDDLGTAVSGDPNEKQIGLEYGGMLQEMLDDQGNEATDGKFTRTFIVCAGTDYDSSNNWVGDGSDTEPNTTVAAGVYPMEKDCEVDPAASQSSRTKWAACLSEDITGEGGAENKEKKLKVLCTWRSRDGRCHSVHLDTTVVKLD